MVPVNRTAALKTLHWFPIRLQIEFKILTLVFRCVHGQAPIYWSNLVNPNVTAGRPDLRSGKRKLYPSGYYILYQCIMEQAQNFLVERRSTL